MRLKLLFLLIALTYKLDLLQFKGIIDIFVHFISDATGGTTELVNIPNAAVLANMMEPRVKVKQGELKGTILPIFDGSGSYYSFKGIRYGHVPARFLAPVPPKPWQGIYDATKHGPTCPQYDMVSGEYTEGDENCLFLNIYTKSIESEAKMPVMVFIHGGMYMYGSGNTETGLGPDFLLQHNVILVTFNYRLEVLGFLCLDTPEVPGNAGMKDQVLALKWVKDNIEQFGGDCNNITVFGESAGSSSVTFHMQSPLSKGLFNKAIAQSGVSIADWSQGKNAKEKAIRAAKYLGKETCDASEILEFLTSVPVQKLAGLHFKTLTRDERHRGFLLHFAPVVETKFDNIEAFITEDPIKALISENIIKIPLILGYNSAESLVFLNSAVKNIDFIDKNLKYTVPRDIACRIPDEETVKIGEKIRKFYTGKNQWTKSDTMGIINFMNDSTFITETHRFANFYCRHSATYLYKFCCDTELNVIKNICGCSHIKGACHVEDLFYIFYSNIVSSLYEENPKIRDIVYRVTKLWTDFAKTGNPTPDNSLGVKWPPYTSSKRAYLNIDETFTVGRNADQASVDFWNKLYCDVGLPCITKSNL